MSEVLCNTKFLQLKATESKRGHQWVYAHRPNADNVVVILPETKDEVLFLIEERPPLQAEYKERYSIALPAGLVGDERKGESTEDAIKSELLEEAGLVAEKIEVVANRVASSAGCLSELSTIAIAHIANKEQVKAPVSDGGIIVDRIWIKKSCISEWLKQKEKEGYILTGQTLAALYYLAIRKENV